MLLFYFMFFWSETPEEKFQRYFDEIKELQKNTTISKYLDDFLKNFEKSFHKENEYCKWTLEMWFLELYDYYQENPKNELIKKYLKNVNKALKYGREINEQFMQEIEKKNSNEKLVKVLRKKDANNILYYEDNNGQTRRKNKTIFSKPNVDNPKNRPRSNRY